MKRTISLILAAGAAAALSTGCTPEEFSVWSAWHDQDPSAAMNWAENEFGQEPDRSDLGPVGGDQGHDSVWDRLAECESGGNWSSNTGAYDGGLQFLPSTWVSMGGRDFAPFAWQATREEQITVAERLLDAAGWGQWPACSKKLGLR